MAVRKNAKVTAPKFREPTPEKQTVTVTKVNPVAMRLAKEMAGGDESRIRVNGDGSVTVLNN